MPDIKPIKTKSDGAVLQPKAPFRSLPANSLHIGPSGSGKTLTLIRTLIDSDKLGGKFQKYLLFSPNIFVDPQYRPLIDYVVETTGQKEEDFCFEDFDQDEIRNLMAEQKKVNAYLRKIDSKRLMSACVVIDDFGERSDIVKSHSSVINSLFTRGRHLQISVYGLLLQRFRLANPTIRYNAHALYVHKLNNQKDLEAIADEFSAVVNGTENFIAMYRKATAKRFGFLFITTGAEPRFFSSYNSEFKVRPESDGE